MSGIFWKNNNVKAANRIAKLTQHFTQATGTTLSQTRTVTTKVSPTASSYQQQQQQEWSEATEATEKIMSKGQLSFNFTKLPLSMDIVQLAANNPIEDARKEHVQEEHGRYFFTIADGHLGPPTAKVVSHYLANYVAHEFQHPDIVKSDSKRVWKDDSTVTGPEQHHPSPEELPGLELKAEAIKRAFVRLDKDIVNGAILPTPPFAPKEPQTSLALAGACGILACLDKRDLFVAGAGDCRSILGRKGEGWEVVPMSRDHTLKDEEEVKRLLRAHPKQEWTGLVSRGRVLGILMPTRAFGDSDFKWPRKAQQLLSRMPLPNLFATPPYLDASPDIYYHRITPNSRFLIMASDGLWDNISNEEAVALVGKELDRREQDDAMVPSDGASEWSVESLETMNENLATMLLRHSLLYGICNGDVRKLKQLLDLPSGQARNYRDDITITVIVFGRGNRGSKSEADLAKIDLSLAEEKGEGRLEEWVKEEA